MMALQYISHGSGVRLRYLFILILQPSTEFFCKPTGFSLNPSSSVNHMMKCPREMNSWVPRHNGILPKKGGYSIPSQGQTKSVVEEKNFFKPLAFAPRPNHRLDEILHRRIVIRQNPVLAPRCKLRHVVFIEQRSLEP